MKAAARWPSGLLDNRGRGPCRRGRTRRLALGSGTAAEAAGLQHRHASPAATRCPASAAPDWRSPNCNLTTRCRGAEECRMSKVERRAGKEQIHAGTVAKLSNSQHALGPSSPPAAFRSGESSRGRRKNRMPPAGRGSARRGEGPSRARGPPATGSPSGLSIAMPRRRRGERQVPVQQRTEDLPCRRLGGGRRRPQSSQREGGSAEAGSPADRRC